MFRLFGKKKKTISLCDLEGNPLKAGDLVHSLRYDLGDCVLEAKEDSFEYVAVNSGERVSWVRMIDASTERQKVLLKEKP